MRPCWTCGKTGHSNTDCPVRKAGVATKVAGNGKSIKALEDIMQDLPSFCVTEEWQAPRRTAKARPMPQG